MEIIKDGAVIPDPYTRITDEALPAPQSDVFVSLDRFQQDRAAFLGRGGRLGVVIPGDQDLAALEADLERFDAVAIELPKFADGRAFSTGRLLRERLGFRGEIRAVGHFLRDQIFYLSRVGFDTFELPEGRDATDALAAFEELTVRYQGAVDEPQPSFRR